ncbi:glycosyltransferase [Flavobacterium sp. HSC-61S13]|uniref:glycosyltransferase n=1 Tax=Flavobacterium sp. HSC-61S13 TaxID=2910963 RepID=UPI00209C9DE6|nr:glycosyltransferase [Flavobacterium sp. HSC-61S13]MCP1995686.1 glycosyltransferase involved in cell wall biosynthesis [Flavobacterium sp. HSC-61S13]
MLTILFYFFIGIVLIQIIYYISVFGPITFRQAQKCTPKRIPISVLICVKNQFEPLKKLLPLLINQSYPDFEIVLINNASTDDSLELMKDCASQFPFVKIVDVVNNEAFWGNKKYALTLGIKAAKNEYLLFIEPDSYPDSPQWIMNLSAQFTLHKTIVIGHARIEPKAKSWTNKLFRFQNTLQTLHVFSWTLMGKPFLGNGRNLAYKKDEFFSVNGYIEHMSLPYGEDSLFINQVAHGKNTTICDAPMGFTTTAVKNNFKSWTSAVSFQNKTLALLGFGDQLKIRFFNFTQITLLISAALLFSFQFEWMIVLAILLFRYLIVWIYMSKACKKFNEKDISYWFPALEFIHTFTQCVIYISHLFSPKKI